MTTPTPVPDPEPGGFLGRIRAWFERDVEPEITAVKADIASLQKLAPALESVANTVVALAEAADPAAAPEIAALVAEAKAAAAVIARIVADLSAPGM
jgi:hypothetical protein